MQADARSRHVILSGCSGGGKSTLLAELHERGFGTIEEPGRRIVLEEQANGGGALPWVDLEAFARRAIEMASVDRTRASVSNDWIFFDRGLVDAALALEHASSICADEILRQSPRYHRLVFLTPPWPEIFIQDSERRHAFKEGVEEYERLLSGYRKLGYGPIILPKIDVKARADFVLERLGVCGQVRN
ncbi:AAA family ATPase [Agrobacterium sp. ES01]|uniref:AAA family ATPase n=1 Tax=Agrobacterium sp. ES01 TaxID=3420714 RepID=UPI003D0C309F